MKNFLLYCAFCANLYFTDCCAMESKQAGLPEIEEKCEMPLLTKPVNDEWYVKITSNKDLHLTGRKGGEQTALDEENEKLMQDRIEDIIYAFSDFIRYHCIEDSSLCCLRSQIIEESASATVSYIQRMLIGEKASLALSSKNFRSNFFHLLTNEKIGTPGGENFPREFAKYFGAYAALIESIRPQTLNHFFYTNIDNIGYVASVIKSPLRSRSYGSNIFATVIMPKFNGTVRVYAIRKPMTVFYIEEFNMLQPNVENAFFDQKIWNISLQDESDSSESNSDSSSESYSDSASETDSDSTNFSRTSSSNSSRSAKTDSFIFPSSSEYEYDSAREDESDYSDSSELEPEQKCSFTLFGRIDSRKTAKSKE